MVKRVAPAVANLGMQLVIGYSPDKALVSEWHTVRDGRESFLSIAEKFGVPADKLINFNFPASVKNGRVDPDVVNWYLFEHQRFHCRSTTRDGLNYMFKGGETVAIPFLGLVEIGEPEFRTPINTKFKIKMHANLNVAFGVAADYAIFQIWDEKAAICSFYTYWAAGVSGGLIPGAWLSATKAGPWNDFEITKAIAVNEFAGSARFTTGGGGSISKNYVNFMGLPAGAKTTPNPLAINTGFTIGIGAGSSVGAMTLEKVGTTDGLLPFKGP